MLKRFNRAAMFFTTNLSLIILLSVSVWVPSVITINCLDLLLEKNLAEQLQWLLSATLELKLIEIIFGLILVGSIIQCLYSLKKGENIGYSTAITTGLSKWGKLILAGIISVVVIFSGLIILVLLNKLLFASMPFISLSIYLLGLVPALILAIFLSVRYSLLDFVVVLEDWSIKNWLGRTAKLTHDRMWEIFVSVISINLTFYLVSLIINYLVGLSSLFFLSSPTNWILGTIQTIFTTAILFDFYWESIENNSVSSKRKIMLSKSAINNKKWKVVSSTMRNKY